MANRIKSESYVNVNQILFNTDPQVSVGIQVTNTGISADADGKKILKAGTPLAGSLEARGTAFVKATTTTADGVSTSNAVGVLLHDVDVTAGAENATMLIFGFVDLNKLTTATASLIDAATKAALKGGVTFLK